MRRKEIVLSQNMNVGSTAAENDDYFLKECFFDHPAKTELEDMNSPKCFALGSTGIGKTALLKKIADENDQANFIDLREVSMTFISNSDVIRFIYSMDVSLDLFFQALWKHVLLIEYIRLAFRVGSEDKSRTILSTIKDQFRRDQTRQEALAYLENYSNRFWVTFDESFREVEQALSEKINADFGGELEKFRFNAGFVQTLGKIKKQQLQARLKQVVDGDLLSELARLTATLAEYSNQKGLPPVRILVDGLDDQWVSEKLKYQLIKALIEALKGLKKIRNLKVIVSLRSDVLERVIQETRHDGFQTEKYEDYFLRIKWSSSQLQELINSRINYLFRSKYDSQNIFLIDLFPDRINKKRPFEFILERSLFRPRDIISFLNACFRTSNDKSKLSVSEVLKAERVYSEERKSALIEEWSSVFPGLEAMLKYFSGKQGSFIVGNLLTSRLLDDLIEAFAEQEEFLKDPVYLFVDRTYSKRGASDDAILDIARALLQSMHLTGIIGLNTHKEEPIHWFFKEQKPVPETSITPEARARVHPMLHSALAIH